MKIPLKINENEIDWTKFKYMVFDLPRHPGTYQERYEALGKVSIKIYTAITYGNSIPHNNLTHPLSLSLSLSPSQRNMSPTTRHPTSSSRVKWCVRVCRTWKNSCRTSSIKEGKVSSFETRSHVSNLAAILVTLNTR